MPTRFKIVVVTPEQSRVDEAEAVRRLFDGGLLRLHVRKPHFDEEAMRRYLDALAPSLLSRVVLHDHLHLGATYGVEGVHLNRRNPKAPDGWGGVVGCSCHTLEEVVESVDTTDYCFLSPLFDSVSKAGYTSRFTPETLAAACRAGTINSRVIALGGITPDNVRRLPRWGFGGAAVLGCVWQLDTIEQLIEQYRNLCFSL